MLYLNPRLRGTYGLPIYQSNKIFNRRIEVKNDHFKAATNLNNFCYVKIPWKGYLI